MATDVSDLSPESIETNIDEATANKNIVHIRIQQRKKTKAVTIVQGLPPKLKLEQVMKYFKKTFFVHSGINVPLLSLSIIVFLLIGNKILWNIRLLYILSNFFGNMCILNSELIFELFFHQCDNI